ncbi:Formin like protein [Phytophthora megakarya]|uniref:Formin like protein n=1 Tax=Phytophthora megakarya TaxID=4795 RepID=A0A225W1Z0_9STRA|nr:Formin like protein [Phytophthora megakarya]
MAPSFISMLMGADKRPAATAASQPSLPHLARGSARAEGLQFGLPMGSFHFGQPQTGASSGTAQTTAHWNDRQKVQDFFRHTTAGDDGSSDEEAEKAAQNDDKAIDMSRNASDSRDSTPTSSTTSEDNQEELRGAVQGRGRLQSALEDLLARQQAEEQPNEEPVERTPLRKKERRRYDSFDIMADVRLSGDDEDLDSVYSTPARSRNNSEDYFGGGLLDMLSQRHMPAGVDRHASVADMLANRALPAPNEDVDEDFDESVVAPQERSREISEPSALQTPAMDRSIMLAEMLVKRPAPSTDSDSMKTATVNKNNALEAMLAKRAAPPPPSSNEETTKPPKVNPLEAMLARRAAPSPPPPAAASEESSGSAHPLAAMLKQRKVAQRMPAATAEVVSPPPPPADSNGNIEKDQIPLKDHPTYQKAQRMPATTKVVSPPPPPADSNGSIEKDQIPLKDHPTYQKYFKMLKVGLPAPVVKHKMQSENVDPAVLGMDPNKPLPEAPAPALDAESETAYQTQLKEYEAKHGKYLQMVKVGLPPAVVEHKMRMDGVDPAWLQGPPKRPEPKPAAVTEVTDEEKAAHRKKYHKYFNMLRLGLPRGAVEQKMRMAGIDPAELNGPRPVAPMEQPKKTLKRKDSIRKKLHWEGKRHRTRRDSLWGGDTVEEAKEQVQISEESRAMLEKLFVKDLTESKKRNASSKSEGGAAAKKKKAMVQLIDMKKSQNIAITLARVKLSYPQLKREILAMNPTVLSPSQVRSLMDMWPDRKEMEAVNAFNGDMATIGTAEQFLVEVRSVPRFQEKLGCLLFKQEFPSRVHELRESLDLVTRGVYQVCSSAELRQLFIYILQIGNLLNFGGDDEQQGVDAFSLGSLVKFSQTKAFVGGITFLQYVVQSIERDVPHLAHFYKDIDLVSKCSKVAYASLASEKNGLETGLQKLLREAETSVATSDASDADKKMMKAYKDTLMNVCKEVKSELYALQELLDKLDAAKAHFLEYFEEEDTEEELDVLLSHIANFTSEYRREHSKYQAKMKKEMMKLYSKLSPSKNLVGAVDPKTPHSKMSHDAKLPHGQHGHQNHGKGAHPHRTSMPPQIDHPQPIRQIHHARVLQLDIPQDDEMDDVSSTASMSPKTSAVLSGGMP